MNKSKIEKIIGKGEEIKGIFYPLKRIPMKKNELVRIPFSIFWTAIIAVFYMFTTIAHGSSDTFRNLFAASLLIFGFYFMIGRFIWALFKISFTVYVVTNERIIIYSKLFKKSKSLYYGGYFKMTLKANKRDYGYILFGEPLPIFGSRGVNFSDDRYIFDNLRKVSLVHKIILESFDEYHQKVNND